MTDSWPRSDDSKGAYKHHHKPWTRKLVAGSTLIVRTQNALGEVNDADFAVAGI